MPSGYYRLKAAKKAKQKAVSQKIEKIMKEGVRRNTHEPISKSNPRRKVKLNQAQAIAYSMMGIKKGRNKK